MIKMKYKVLLSKDFNDGLQALSQITDIKAASVLISCGKIVRDIRKAGDEYNEARQKIMTSLGAGPNIVLAEDAKKELNDRLSDLVETEFELDHKKINLKDLPHKNLSPGHIASLEDILVIPE